MLILIQTVRNNGFENLPSSSTAVVDPMINLQKSNWRIADETEMKDANFFTCCLMYMSTSACTALVCLKQLFTMHTNIH